MNFSRLIPLLMLLHVTSIAVIVIPAFDVQLQIANFKNKKIGLCDFVTHTHITDVSVSGD